MTLALVRWPAFMAASCALNLLLQISRSEQWTVPSAGPEPVDVNVRPETDGYSPPLMTAGLLGEETGGIMLTHSDKAAACAREVQKGFPFHVGALCFVFASGCCFPLQ